MLEDEPHAFHIIAGISPVAACIEVSQIQLILKTLRYACGSQCNLTRHESFSTPFALMVEEDTVDGEHAVAFAVVLRNPETVLLGYTIRAARIERSRLLLGHFLYFAEQFGSGCLIYLCFLFQS